MENGARLPIEIERQSQTVVGLKVAVGESGQPGRLLQLHLVQRKRRTNLVIGGVAVQVNVRRR